MSEAPRLTPLHDEHRRLGARMIAFGGFEMPVQYAGIVREHAAVRERAGIFDLSHMAQYEVRGPGAVDWLDALTVNRVASMAPYRARYNIFTNARGGCLDDVIVYRLPDRLLVVVNAANAATMWPYLQRLAAARADVELANRHGVDALVAVQGPRAVALVASLCDCDVTALKYYACVGARVADVAALVARTGYTGEDGFELFVASDDAPRLWRSLLERGEAAGVEPVGLGARDVLRLEAGMPLYGHELSPEISPLAGGQRRVVDFTKALFPGRAALEEQRLRDDYDRIVGITLAGRVPAREGYRVFAGDDRVGSVRSGSYSPSLGKNVATALVRRDAATVGTELAVEIRGTRYDATVVALPFYKRIV
ncbi:MAG: glycine cleavage system aminomethyltransferase GcvT [Vulcanimicrobiaceae bacterium]